MNNTNTVSERRLIPLTRWADFHPWPTTSALRWLVFNERANGFDRCVRRVGRRVLIDEGAFFQWVESQGSSEGSR